jgi:ferritin
MIDPPIDHLTNLTELLVNKLCNYSMTKNMKLLSSARSITPQLAALLTNQANRELDASRMYLSFNLWFDYHDYPGSAKWCRTHSEEERVHAMKIFDHLALRKTESACTISKDMLNEWKIEDIDPNTGKLSDIWKMALDQEVENSQKYFEMAKLAEEEHDLVTRQFLDWFLNEQLMEENAVSDIYEKAIKLEQTGGLYRAMDADFTTMDH